MDNLVKCPNCHTDVKLSDYFCYNCGKSLKPSPLSMSLAHQMLLYAESILLPPYGIVIGLRYLKDVGDKSKVVGIVCIVLTVLSLIIFTKLTLDFVNNINKQIGDQLIQMGGL